MPQELSLEELLAQAGGEQTPPDNTSPASDNTPPENQGDGQTPTPDNTSPASDNTPPASDNQPPAEGDKDGDKTPPANPDNKSKPNPMKEIRDRYNREQKAREKVEGAMKRFTNGDYDLKLKDFKTEDGNVDYDKFIEAMDKIDNEAKAKTNNITPEMQEAIDKIERERQELAKEKIKVAMERELSDLQVVNSLNKADINNFFKDSMALNKNPYQWLNQGGSLQELYELVYKDKIMEAKINEAVAKAKLEWDKSRSTPPTPNPANITPDSSTDGLSLSDLLNEAFNKGK